MFNEALHEGSWTEVDIIRANANALAVETSLGYRVENQTLATLVNSSFVQASIEILDTAVEGAFFFRTIVKKFIDTSKDLLTAATISGGITGTGYRAILQQSGIDPVEKIKNEVNP